MIDNFQNYLDIMFQKENTSWDSIFKDDKKEKTSMKILILAAFMSI